MANATDPKPGDIISEDGKFYQIGESGSKVQITEEQAKERGWIPGGQKSQDDQPDPAEVENRPGPPGRDAVLQAAKSAEDAAKMTAEQRQDALEWFMQDSSDEEPATKTIELNVSTDPNKEVWVNWTVGAMQRERIQEIRDKAKRKTRKRRGADPEEDANAAVANLRIAAEGSVYPNLKDASVRGDFLDPADALNYRFRNKPGLIDQICAAVIEVSGYDEEDVREVDAVKT